MSSSWDRVSGRNPSPQAFSVQYPVSSVHVSVMSCPLGQYGPDSDVAMGDAMRFPCTDPVLKTRCRKWRRDPSFAWTWRWGLPWRRRWYCWWLFVALVVNILSSTESVVYCVFWLMVREDQLLIGVIPIFICLFFSVRRLSLCVMGAWFGKLSHWAGTPAFLQSMAAVTIKRRLQSQPAVKVGLLTF